MKHSFVRAALLRAAACLAALALVLPVAVFAADHTGHDGWTELPNNITHYEKTKYYLKQNMAITDSTFYGTVKELCLNGCTLTLNGDVSIKTGGGLTIEDCQGGGSIKSGTITVNADAVLTLVDAVNINSAIMVNRGAKIDRPTGGTLNVTGGTVSGSITVRGKIEGQDYLEGGTMNVSGGTVSGDITVGDGATMTVSGGTISGDITVGDGATMTVTGGDISGSITVNSGGTLTVSGGTINGSITVNKGGTLKADNVPLSGGVTVNGGTATLTGATVTGKNITVNSGSCTISGGEIKNITTNGNGGGVCVNGGSCTISGDVKIRYNTAQNGNGGGVYVAGGGSCNILGEAHICDNTAKNGGGVYVETGGDCLIFGKVYDNTATGNGGGVYLAGPGTRNYNFDNANINFNTAQNGNGGGVYMGEGVDLQLTGANVGYNTASGSGGGFYLSNGGQLSFSGQLIYNKANGGNGGGICAFGDCTIILRGNSATSELAKISGNTASGKGSGIYVDLYQGSATSFPGEWTVNFYGANVSDDLYLCGNVGRVNIESIMGSSVSTLSGKIYISNALMYMKQGTINSPEVTADGDKSSLYISGGYCSISGFKTQDGAIVDLSGGYFNALPTDPGVQVDSRYEMLRLDESDSDPDFDADFPYAVYKVNTDVSGAQRGTPAYDGSAVEQDTDFTLNNAGGATVRYSYKAAAAGDDAYGSGLPANAGEYTIKAECLNTTDKWYANVTFGLTIAKADPTCTAPTGLSGLHGHPLSEVTLPESWAWQEGADTTLAEAGDKQFTALFTPTDTGNYNTVEVELTVTVAHDWGAWYSNGNGVHTGYCKCAGCDTTCKESCSGGTAGYFTKAVCAVCGGEYGDFALDTAAPTGEIAIQTNKWNTLLQQITFGLFFKDTQTVTITADDDSYTQPGYDDSKAVSVGWALYRGDTPPTTVEALEAENFTFTSYTAPFTIQPDDKLVVYAKITDHANNVTYISSDGLVLDGTAPVISGVENGGVYYVTQAVTAADENLDKVMVNGVTQAQAAFALAGNGENTYTITARDKAGNETTITVTTKPIAALAAAVEDVTADTVAFADEADLTAALAAANEVDTADATQDEKEELAALIAQLEELLEVLDEAKAAQAAVAALPESVEPDDEATEADIHAAEALYDALSPHQQALIPEAGQKLAKLLADLSDYRLTQGDGSSWRKGDANGLTFTANGPLRRFTGVLLDGQAVDAANYTVEEGSTIVTLKREYLEGLAVGDHTLTVEYRDGAAAGSFEVLEARPWTPGPTATPAPAAAVATAAGAPQTGDGGPLAWACLLTLSAASLAAAWGLGRRRAKK